MKKAAAASADSALTESERRLLNCIVKQYLVSRGCVPHAPQAPLEVALCRSCELPCSHAHSHIPRQTSALRHPPCQWHSLSSSTQRPSAHFVRLSRPCRRNPLRYRMTVITMLDEVRDQNMDNWEQVRPRTPLLLGTCRQRAERAAHNSYQKCSCARVVEPTFCINLAHSRPLGRLALRSQVGGMIPDALRGLLRHAAGDAGGLSVFQAHAEELKAREEAAAASEKAAAEARKSAAILEEKLREAHAEAEKWQGEANRRRKDNEVLRDEASAARAAAREASGAKHATQEVDLRQAASPSHAAAGGEGDGSAGSAELVCLLGGMPRITTPPCVLRAHTYYL